MNIAGSITEVCQLITWYLSLIYESFKAYYMTDIRCDISSADTSSGSDFQNRIVFLRCGHPDGIVQIFLF